MGYWNHRVVRHKSKLQHEELDGKHWFGIHEVYYNEDRSVVGYGETSANLYSNDGGDYGDAVNSLRKQLTHMLTALDKPILDADTLQEV